MRGPCAGCEMEVEFGNKDCDRLETDPSFNAGHFAGSR